MPSGLKRAHPLAEILAPFLKIGILVEACGGGGQKHRIARSRIGGGGGILNLSLDLTELSDLSQYRLSCTDFAPTDMTVDMLYLIEAKSAAMAETRRLIQRLEGARLAAETQAVTDPLTGLHNRRGLDGILTRMVSERRSFALTQLDLDHFKQVNDTLGHGAGDHVLQTAAQVLVDKTAGQPITSADWAVTSS